MPIKTETSKIWLFRRLCYKGFTYHHLLVLEQDSWVCQEGLSWFPRSRFHPCLHNNKRSLDTECFRNYHPVYILEWNFQELCFEERAPVVLGILLVLLLQIGKCQILLKMNLCVCLTVMIPSGERSTFKLVFLVFLQAGLFTWLVSQSYALFTKQPLPVNAVKYLR